MSQPHMNWSICWKQLLLLLLLLLQPPPLPPKPPRDDYYCCRDFDHDYDDGGITPAITTGKSRSILIMRRQVVPIATAPKCEYMIPSCTVVRIECSVFPAGTVDVGYAGHCIPGPMILKYF